MKAAQMAERLVEIIEAGKKMQTRATHYAEQMRPEDLRHAAEAGGLRTTVTSMLEDLEVLLVEVRGAI